MEYRWIDFLMKEWIKYTAAFLWVFLFIYLVNLFKIPKNIYYLLIGGTLILGGLFFIFYLFEKSNKNK